MVKALQWSDSFAVGHEMIDREHQILVQLINDIAAAARANDGRVADLLQKLGRVVKDHFRTENSVLWELRMGSYERLKHSPKASRIVAGMASTIFDDHMAEHKVLLGRFDEVARAPLDTLGEILKAWFVDHAVKRDSHLKTIFQAIR
jgi:hemerythrin